VNKGFHIYLRCASFLQNVALKSLTFPIISRCLSSSTTLVYWHKTAEARIVPCSRSSSVPQVFVCKFDDKISSEIFSNGNVKIRQDGNKYITRVLRQNTPRITLFSRKSRSVFMLSWILHGRWRQKSHGIREQNFQFKLHSNFRRRLNRVCVCVRVHVTVMASRIAVSDPKKAKKLGRASIDFSVTGFVLTVCYVIVVVIIIAALDSLV